MQDKYVGDIGDFAKYGLLRYLCGKTGPPMDSPLILGVVWYFTEERGGGGSDIGYLSMPRPPFDYDPTLFNQLTRLIHLNRRRVREVEEADILPQRTLHYLCKVRLRAARLEWRREACEKIADAELVFLDPNTGIETANDRGPDYARNDEIAAFAHCDGRDRSLVIYQHASRGTGLDFLRIRCLSRRLGRPVWTFQWGLRYFLISPASRHEELLRQRLELFRNLWEFGDRP